MRQPAQAAVFSFSVKYRERFIVITEGQIEKFYKTLLTSREAREAA